MEDIMNVQTVNVTLTHRQRYFNKVTGVLAMKGKIDLTKLKVTESTLISTLVSKILLAANNSNFELADKLLFDLQNEDYSYIINILNK